MNIRLYAAVVVGAGLGLLALAVGGVLAQPISPGWLMLALLTPLTGSLMVKVPGVETRVSLSDTLVVATLLLFGPAHGAVVFALDALVATVRFNRQADTAFRCAFNVSVATISSWVPGTVFFALLRSGPLVRAATPPLGALAGPIVVMVALYFLINTSLIAGIIALQRRSNPLAVWRQNFAWVWLLHAWNASIATLFVVYVPQIDTTALALVVGVVLVSYATVQTYLTKVEEATRHLRRLNALYASTVQALAVAIDAKDQVTHGHIKRVQTYALHLARALGIDDETTLKGIEAAALLHDTGKIGIPEHILNKPGRLTEAEFDRMKEHVLIGVEILNTIDFPYPVIPFVRHHHENWDGSGYPDGLRGEAIPLGARILSVVDCFDALTSDRPYRRRLSADEALAILEERNGRMYDPAVVRRFAEILPTLPFHDETAADAVVAATAAPQSAPFPLTA